MNRKVTNVIRFLMDECLPPILRDNKYFMYPFYVFAYRGKNIKQVMNFKALVHQFDDEEYENFYRNLDSVSRNRETDLNPACLDRIVALLDREVLSVLDVGCGAGFLLMTIRLARPDVALTGCDIVRPPGNFDFDYFACNLHKPGGIDRIYDVVTCTHTLEHVLNIQAAVERLRQACRKYLIVVVPCQRYFFYTLDEHVHFITHAAQIAPTFGLKQADILTCEKLDGDWLIVIKGRA